MRKHIIAGLFVVMGLPALAASAVTIKGADTVQSLTLEVIERCSGTSSIVQTQAGNAASEQALLAGQQPMAPMTRFLSELTCSHSTPQEAEGVVAALDAIVATTDDDSIATCSGGLAWDRSITVSELNGLPGLQCAGCAGGAYDFTSWTDVLRVLYAGMENTMGDEVSLRDCDSDLRRSLVQTWANLFEGSCSGGPCAELRRAFRPADSSAASEVLLSFLDLPPAADIPYCNARRTSDTFPLSQPVNNPPFYPEVQDVDPIRRACAGTGDLPVIPAGGEPPNAPTEQVCRRDGTLGLVLPILPPPVHATNSPTPYPNTPCVKGKFVFGFTPAGEKCPNDDTPFGANQCLIPADASNDPRCLNGKNNTPSFEFDGAPLNTTDGRAYNLVLRKGPGGAIATLARPNAAAPTLTNVPMIGAFYRIHSTRTLNALSNVNACSQLDASKQLGCLTQASPCSLSVAGKRAGLYAGTLNHAISGIAPSVANIQGLVEDPPDPATYPLSHEVYLNSMVGAEGISDTAQFNFWTCWKQGPLVTAAAVDAGFVTLPVVPYCVDFDERDCGTTLLNRNACKKGTNFCPVLDSWSVAPTTTQLGGTMNLDASGHDPEFVPDPLQYVWTSTAGEIADQFAASTTYTCTELGNHSITLTLYDGRCLQPTNIKTFAISCTPAP